MTQKEKQEVKKIVVDAILEAYVIIRERLKDGDYQEIVKEDQ
jgi:hypothetical protein